MLRKAALPFHMKTNFHTLVFFITEVLPEFQALLWDWMVESKVKVFTFILGAFRVPKELSADTYYIFGWKWLASNCPFRNTCFQSLPKGTGLKLSEHTPFSQPLLFHCPQKKRKIMKTDRVANFFISQTYKHSRKQQTYYFLTCTLL